MSISPRQLCTRCARIAHSTAFPRPRTRQFSSSISSSNTSSTSSSRSETTETRDQVRQRAWFLQDNPVLPAPSSQSSPPSITTENRSIPSEPRFTTFDPLSTTIDSPDQSPIIPLPFNAPPYLSTLHTFLTSPENNSFFSRGSVKFLHTPSAKISSDPDNIELIRPRISNSSSSSSSSFSSQEDGMISEEEIRVSGGGSRENSKVEIESDNGRWEWVVVAEVVGRGKGVVARAERILRRWLRENPLTPGMTPSRGKFPRANLETDWALIPVGTGNQLCINLFTEEGRIRWNLEDLWSTSKDHRQ